MTGEEGENDNASPSKQAKGTRGRKPAPKTKKDNQETETGGDETAESENQSPSKGTKGKPGRKPGQTNKNTASKDADQEPENGNDAPSVELDVYLFFFQSLAKMMTMKMHHQVNKLKANVAVKLVKKRKERIKKPKLVKMILRKKQANHLRKKPKVDVVVSPLKQQTRAPPIKIPTKKLERELVYKNRIVSHHHTLEYFQVLVTMTIPAMKVHHQTKKLKVNVVAK